MHSFPVTYMEQFLCSKPGVGDHAPPPRTWAPGRGKGRGEAHTIPHSESWQNMAGNKETHGINPSQNPGTRCQKAIFKLRFRKFMSSKATVISSMPLISYSVCSAVLRLCARAGRKQVVGGASTGRKGGGGEGRKLIADREALFAGVY